MGEKEKAASGVPTAEELALIGRYTRRELAPEEVYTFPVLLCDNEIDREGERFSIPALEKLADLFVGKTGIFDHEAKGRNQTARIYRCQVVREEGRRTAAGEVYHALRAEAYMLRGPGTEELIREIDGGIKKEVSVGCAVAAALLGRPAEEMTGKGAGLSDEGLARKIAVIDRAIALHRPDPEDPVDVIAKVGGYDIAAMTGFYIGCALHRTPAVMDGFISTVAALAAVRLCPAVRDALTASHLSAEPGAGYVMEELGLSPLLKLGMALGEGTGAVSVMPLIDMALRVYFDMPSFDNIGIDAYQPL